MFLLPTPALTGYSRGTLQVASVQGPHHLGAESRDDPETQVRQELRPLVRGESAQVGR